MTDSEPLIPKHGGYRRLKSFQLVQLIYDMTVRFCDRYIDRRSRTHDQMVQAWVADERRLARTSGALHGQSRTITDGHGRKGPDPSVRVRGSPCSSVPSSAHLAANAALSLLNLCCRLLDRQLDSLAKAFENEGGCTERLYRVRRRRRRSSL